MAEKNYIISLIHLLKNNIECINCINQSLHVRGYAFIRLDEKFVSLIDESLSEMENFFTLDINSKRKYFKAPIFGYFDVPHKESFRILTGSRLKEHLFPESFNKIKFLINIMDKIMYRIVTILKPYVFANREITKNIPLLKENNRWGMFDVAKYNNNHLEMKCKEHFDPGLLSLSLRSTQHGLQLKNEYGEWIDPPRDKNIAILWTGDAAVKINPLLKHGIHRVINKSNIHIPRIAMWYEICTFQQEHRELLNDKINKNMKDIKYIPKKFENDTGIPFSKIIGHPQSPYKINDDNKNYNKHMIQPYYSNISKNLYSL
jgi:hypothetical protein